MMCEISNRITHLTGIFAEPACSGRDQALCDGSEVWFIASKLAIQGGGVILNIASDLAVIAPDQRIYKKKGLPDKQQPTKPVSYSVVKTGLIGLTKYLATYWADKGVRVNSISPGGIYADQDPEFIQRLTNLIPLGRMAHEDEYKAAVIFLVSDASSYMTGANLVIDGGRSCW